MIFIYTYFDAHCDTMFEMYKNGLTLNTSSFMFNTNNLNDYKKVIQVFALFNNGNLNKKNMLSIFDFFKNECEKMQNIVSICKTKQEIEENKKPLSAILAIEALGNQPDFSITDIKDFYNIGVRFISLVWNNDNILCGGCENNNSGLTLLGRQALKELEKYRIILDVSHMSDKSFWESLENYNLPICATHSCSRIIHNHPRNLTDEQFMAIVNRGGVCGINFYPSFLGGENTDVNTIIRHIEHFMSLGGENSIGIGSDFDGIDNTPTDIKNSADIYKIFDKLLSLNYSEDTVEKIAYRNFLNLF